MVLPTGSEIVRLYGGGRYSNPQGQWWFTWYELTSILDHFAREDISPGRDEGKGIMHAVFGVLRFEWMSTCRYFTVLSLNEPLYAFYGEGDHAFGDEGAPHQRRNRDRLHQVRIEPGVPGPAPRVAWGRP